MGTTESIRKDSAKRTVDPKQTNDWGGKRVILPKGTTLPAVGIPGEVFVKIRNGNPDQLFIWNEDDDAFITVGPKT